MINKNNQVKKTTLHSSFLHQIPKLKPEDPKFQTYYSLETKNTDRAPRHKLEGKMQHMMKNQLRLIEQMSKKNWLREANWESANDRNLPDLLRLIKKQKTSENSKHQSLFKSKHQKTNYFSLKNDDPLRLITAQLLSEIASNVEQPNHLKSNHHEFSDQPTKVKLFKRLSIFYRNGTMNKISRNNPQARNNEFLEQAFLKRRSRAEMRKSEEEAATPREMKISSSSGLEDCSLTKQRVLFKQQSMQCKGEILTKDDEVGRRKRFIRKLSFIEKELDAGNKEPVFLLQI